MKEEYSIPKFYKIFVFIALALILVSLCILLCEKRLSELYYIIIIENLIFLIVICYAIYSYKKINVIYSEGRLILNNNWKRQEIDLTKITEIKITSLGNIILRVQSKLIHFNYRFVNSAALFKLFYNELLEKRADLMNDQMKKQLNEVFKIALSYDLNTYIIDRMGFLTTALSMISFFVAMFVIVDHSSIEQFGQISYLLYALGWPFLTWLFLFLRFLHKTKTVEIENTDPNISNEYFHKFPYSLIFSTFAEIFIVISIIKYFNWIG